VLSAARQAPQHPSTFLWGREAGHVPVRGRLPVSSEGSGSKLAGHEIGVSEHVVPNVYAQHRRVDPEPDEQEPQQFPEALQERVAGHDPDAGT